MEEGSLDGDSYEARLNVYAGYLMGDIAVAESLRAFGGTRLEKTDQAIEPFNPFGGTVNVPSAELESTDWLPALGLVFSATSHAKTRFSYGRTLARPQLRELAPFAFSDYFGGKQISGNPNLTLTTIDNYDMRFEYFPSLRETLAFSIFFKDFTDPIEPVLVPAGGQNVLTYRNAEAAKLLGLELEARKDLYFLSAALKDFTLVANLTLVWSRTEVEQTGGSEDGVPFISNPSRPLVNQAPWVVNLQLDYENEHGTGARALYNVSGRALVEVGTQGMPDAYRQPMHSVDLVASQDFWEKFQAKVEATNVLNAKTLVTQGKTPTSTNATSEYREGVTIGLGLSYTH
jgi:TonB-dependent receptor